MFVLGLFVGLVAASVVWILYMAYFGAEAEGLGGRVRRWIRKQWRRVGI